MKAYILIFVFHIFSLPLFSQVLQKEMLVFRFIEIRGECSPIYKAQKDNCFYQSNLVLIEFVPHFKWKRDLYPLCEKGIYSFFKYGSDSINIVHNNEQLNLIMNALSDADVNEFEGNATNLIYLNANKYLKTDLFWDFYPNAPEWAGKNLYIDVFKAKISYVYLGKTECLVPNIKYNRRTRDKVPLKIPLICNAYELVGVEYIELYPVRKSKRNFKPKEK